MSDNDNVEILFHIHSNTASQHIYVRKILITFNAEVENYKTSKHSLRHCSPDVRLKADVALHVVVVSPEEALNVIVGVV